MFLGGLASWYCDGCKRDFSTPEPDRTACIDNWVAGVEDMFNTAASSTDISKEIYKNLEDNKNITGGSVVKLTEIFDQLLYKRNEEKDNDNDEFTENFMNSTNSVIGSRTGWSEISNNDTKYKTVSSYLESLDFSAYLWAEKESLRSVCNENKTFIYSHISVITRVTGNSPNAAEEECFSFTGQGTICVPVEREDSTGNCNIFVASAVKTREKIDQQDSFIFPSTTGKFFASLYSEISLFYPAVNVF